MIKNDSKLKFFTHEVNFNQSPENKYIIKHTGFLGYGVYMYLLETLAGLDNRIDLSNVVIESMICDDLRLSLADLKKLLEVFIKAGAISTLEDNSNVIFSPIIQDALNKVEAMSKLRREARLKGIQIAESKKAKKKKQKDLHQELDSDSDDLEDIEDSEHDYIPVQEVNVKPHNNKVIKEIDRNILSEKSKAVISVFEDNIGHVGRLFELRTQPNELERQAYIAFCTIGDTPLFEGVNEDQILASFENLINVFVETKESHNKSFFYSNLWNLFVDRISIKEDFAEFRPFLNKIINKESMGINQDVIQEFKRVNR